MLPGRKYTAAEVVRILRRRWWLILLPLVLGTTAGVVAYKWLPVKYQSETLITVMPQQIPDSYVKSTVTNVEDRLRTVSEQILSRSRLEKIIQDFHLYEAPRATGLMEDVIKQMRGDITVELVGKESSFRVAYISSDPKTAQKVTERLAALYIEENLRDQANLAENTSGFLESQLQDAKQRLVAQEKKLEEYRRRYAGQLPSQLQGNLQSVQNAQVQLQSLMESMNRARERRLLVERQIADVQSLPVEVVVPGATTASPNAPPSTASRPARCGARAARTTQTALHARVSGRSGRGTDSERAGSKGGGGRVAPDAGCSARNLCRRRRQPAGSGSRICRRKSRSSIASSPRARLMTPV